MMVLIGAGAALLLAGGAGALLLRRHPSLADRVYAGSLVSGCAVAGVAAAGALRPGAAAVTWAPAGAAGAAWGVGLDPLTAWFLLAILGVGACAGLYGVGYLAPERAHGAGGAGVARVAGAHALFATLLAALVGVVTARGMFSFLVAWEVMALSAYLLVMHEHEAAAVRRAGFIYLALTHVSTLALLALFAALRAPASAGSFAALAAGSAPGSAGAAGRTLVLALALVGFGIKAGTVPVHFWLPGAHAAAPSHVSAVLSGVMLKVGIYGLLRVLWLLGGPPAWLGWTLLGLGLASGILGVLWALGQHDLKRLLAYHSVENVGIILLAMGVGVLGSAYGAPAVAVLGYAGALLHTLNHAVFKSLLFLGAGAVVRATGTRALDRLGGLGRVMPWTGVAFGVGAVAIVGLPPLNGFVSEWIIFQGLLSAGRSSEALRFAAAGAAGLALIGALALACFSKVVGVIFLGTSRTATPLARSTSEPGWSMRLPMVVLATVCVLIGVVPAPAIAVVHDVVVGSAAVYTGKEFATAPWATAGATLTWFGVSLIALTGLALGLRRTMTRARSTAISSTWACGSVGLTPRMQYSASSYAAPLLGAFGPVSGIHRAQDATSFETHPVDVVQDLAVIPVWHGLERVSVRLRSVQGGRLRWYLASVILTVLMLLIYLGNARPTP